MAKSFARGSVGAIFHSANAAGHRPKRKINLAASFEACVQRLEARLHFGRGADAAECVVLVGCGHAEHAHDRVADELLDGSAVCFDRTSHLAEVVEHQLPDRLGIDPFGERGRSGDVREQQRRGLAPLILLRRQAHAAAVAEPCRGHVLVAAERAGRHLAEAGSRTRFRCGRRFHTSNLPRFAGGMWMAALFRPDGPGRDRTCDLGIQRGCYRVSVLSGELVRGAPASEGGSSELGPGTAILLTCC